MNRERSSRKIKKIIDRTVALVEKENRIAKKMQKGFTNIQTIEHSSGIAAKKLITLNGLVDKTLENINEMRKIKEDQDDKLLALQQKREDVDQNIQDFTAGRYDNTSHNNIFNHLLTTNCLKQSTKLYVSDEMISNNIIEGVTWKSKQNFSGFQLDSSKMAEKEFKAEIWNLISTSSKNQMEWSNMFFES